MAIKKDQIKNEIGEGVQDLIQSALICHHPALPVPVSDRWYFIGQNQYTQYEMIKRRVLMSIMLTKTPLASQGNWNG